MLDQLDLAYRIAAARHGFEPKTWDEIAEAEGIPKRTLQHFFHGWLESVGAPTERRAERTTTRDLDRLQRYYSFYH